MPGPGEYRPDPFQASPVEDYQSPRSVAEPKLPSSTCPVRHKLSDQRLSRKG